MIRYNRFRNASAVAEYCARIETGYFLPHGQHNKIVREFHEEKRGHIEGLHDEKSIRLLTWL